MRERQIYALAHVASGYSVWYKVIIIVLTTSFVDPLSNCQWGPTVILDTE
jgi:hypothetical protein